MAAGMIVRRTVMGTDGEIMTFEDQVNGTEFNGVRFSNETFGEESSGRPVELIYNVKDWSDMNAPHEITVSIEIGNTLGE